MVWLHADHLKQQLLRVQLTTNPSETPSSLLQHLSTVLISLGNRRPQTRAGLLMLLSTWLHNCPLAVAQFIAVEENVQYLTTHIDGYGTEGSEDENQVVRGLIAFLLTICLVFDESGEDKSRKNALSMVVERRVGKEKLVELLEGLSHSEHYVKAAQRPQPLAKSAQDLLLDYHFTKFFKSVEGQMVKQICPSAEISSSNINNDSVFNSYKELIKRQDETIASLSQQIKKLKEDAENQQNYDKENELASLWKQLAEQCHVNGTSISGQQEIEHYKCMAMQWQSEAKRYQKWAEQWQQYQITQSSNPQDPVVEQLIFQNKELEEQLEHGWQMYNSQGLSLAAALSEIEQAKAKIRILEEQIAQTALDRTYKQVVPAEIVNSDELTVLKKEQEDLLVLLADQDTKILEYRRKLTELGQAVTDDEDTDA
ncbi:hypothetical protein LOAG_02375 [Loa loa]|uniref:Vesicle tethering protein Uso1/P115-like head domain-containing protein n=1 Tax=Loa loa TaxID=7209 RepID=A0A1S0U8S3_LOALO|nr:hypothetical protein LOAG_02375 [Loa loa]EFO26107.1 hypothetical protein LOAG_02375 [Loa loa]